MVRRLLLIAASGIALAAVPALADTTRDKMPQIFTTSPMGVNMQSGTFVHSETDFTIGSLNFVRSWRAVPSFYPAGGQGLDHHMFGAWNHNYGFGATWHPTINDGVNVYADGKVYQFRWTSVSSTWTPWNLEQHNNNAFGASLTGTVGSNLVFRNQAGDVYTMNADNQATSVVYANGTRLDLSYDGSKRLRTIISNRGDAIVLDYGSNSRLATACGFNLSVTYVGSSTTCSGAPVSVSYTYSSTTAAQGWVLSSVTGADGQATSMTYDTYYRPNLTCITLTASSTCRITNAYGAQSGDLDPTNTLPDQVRVQTTATGEVWQYFYSNMSQYADWPPIQFGETRTTETNMTDPLGRGTTIIYENGFVRHVTAPEGHTEYLWASLNPSVFIQPGGNRQVLVHNYNNTLSSRTWRVSSTPASTDIVQSYGYVACDSSNFRICTQPSTATDARGNVTDYTYDTAHGGVLTMTRPAPSSGAVRPQTRYSYSQIYAGVRNSGGSLVSASTPVWVLTQESQCRTQSSCSGTSDEILTTYEYGSSGSADALRLRGTMVSGNGFTARTCYGYDALGNRISETGPGAQLSSCP